MSSRSPTPDPELQRLNDLAAQRDQVDAQEEQAERFYRRATSVSLALLGFSAERVFSSDGS